MRLPHSRRLNPIRVDHLTHAYTHIHAKVHTAQALEGSRSWKSGKTAAVKADPFAKIKPSSLTSRNPVRRKLCLT